MKKRIFQLILVLLLTSTSIFANSNTSLFKDNKGLRVVSSEHFNIIYNNESSLLANKIYENAEQILDDITSYYDLSNEIVFNVVVTPNMQQFNSYFSSFPNRIVIFDTIATNNFFNYFDNNLMLNIFKHELTHALSLTDDNKFITNTFGKLFSPATLFTSGFQREGVSVLYESKNNQGRLNSSAYNALLYQTKLEGIFPSYYDVQGNRDILANSDYYLFGSFFFQYLIDTYGIDKFNKYWELNSSWNFLLVIPNYSFKEIYNISISEAWSDFEKSIDNLEVDSKIKIKRKESVYPQYIVGSGNNIFVGNYSQNNTIKVENDNLDTSIFSNTYSDLGEVSVNEGSLSLTKYNYGAQPSTYTKIVNNGEEKTYNIDNFRLAIELDSNTLVGLKNEGEIQYLQWIDTNTLKPIKNYYLKDNEAIQNISIYNNDIVFTSRIGFNNYLSILSDDNRVLYNLGDGVSIEGLNIYKNKALLSTIKDFELARLSIIDLKSARMDTMNSNIVGGVYSPTMLDKENLVFISKYYNRSYLSLLKLSDVEFNTTYLEKTYVSENVKKETSLIIDNSREYKTLDFIFDDKIFVPIFQLRFNSDDKFEFLTTGFSYNIADPVQSYSASFEPVLHINNDFKSVNLKTYFIKNSNNNRTVLNPYFIKYFGTSSNSEYLLRFKLSNTYTFDLQNNDRLNIKSSLNFTNTNSENLFLAKDYKIKNQNQNKFGSSLFVYYNYKKQAGLNYLSVFKLNLGVGIDLSRYNKFYTESNVYDDINLFSISSNFSINIPYLIPQFDSYTSSSTATKLSGNLTYQTLTNSLLFSGEINSVLYSKEIQRGINLIFPFYYNRLIIDTGIKVSGKSDFNNNGNISDLSSSVYLSTKLKNSLNTTSMYSAPFDIGVGLNYDIIKKKGPTFMFVLGFSS